MREELTVRILRIDGEEESHILTGGPAGAMKTIAAMIGAANLDTINLRDGRVMIVDDDGYEVELVDHGPGDGAMGGKPGVHFDTRIERRCVRAKKTRQQRGDPPLLHGARRP